MNRILLVLATFLVTGCAGQVAGTLPATTYFTVLHTNDHHGRFWRSDENEHGLAARKTLIDRIRAEVRGQGGHVLLLDAGDVNTGVPESDMQDAEPDFRGMSLLGYDAMAVGNHEFDKSLSTLLRQKDEWSNFPWLSANVYQGGGRMFTASKLFQLGPLSVAVLGLTTDETARMVVGFRFPGIEVRAPIQEAKALVPSLRSRADVVVALTHMGHYLPGQRGVSAPGDVELAQSVPGIDLIVGGHTHHTVCMVQENLRDEAYEPGGSCAPDRRNGAWIVQAGDRGRFLGRADFEHVQGRLRLLRYTLIPINLRWSAKAMAAPLPEDEQALALLTPFQERASAGLSAFVGRSVGVFDGERSRVRHRATSLGRLITAAMIEKTRADVALVSAGGIRDSLPDGVIAYRDLLKVQPFGNRVIVVPLSGAQLEAYLRQATRMTPGSGAFAQMSGARWVEEGEAAARLWVNGHPVDPAGAYRLAVTSFVARGGDGYPDLSTHPGFMDTGLVEVDVLRDFIVQRGTVRALDFEPFER